jgi:hypothetical protein
VRLTYNKLKVAGREYGETRTISIDAGSQLTRIIQSYDGVSEPMRVAAGLSKRDGRDSIIAKSNYLIYAEPYSDKVDRVFLAMIFPDGYKNSLVHRYTIGNKEYSHVLAVCDYEKPVRYYSGYGWSKAGVFFDLSSFEKYVAEFSNCLNHPLKISY